MLSNSVSRKTNIGRIVVAALLGLVASRAPVSAQTSAPTFELFGGYSYLPAGGDDFPRTASSGFQATIAGNVNSWFSIVGDIGGQYSRSSNLGFNFRGVTAKTSVYEFLLGPRFTLRRPVTPFVHTLVGTSVGHTNLGGFADSGFTLAFGGGADAAINRRLSARGQIDWLGSFADILETNLRMGVGLVVRFGR